MSQSYLDLWRSFQGNTTIWELQLYCVPVHEASRQQVRVSVLWLLIWGLLSISVTVGFSHGMLLEQCRYAESPFWYSLQLPGWTIYKRCQKPSWFSRSCDVVLKHLGSEVALCMCGGGVSLFLFVSFCFLFKFVGSFFSMVICLSFGGLLVVFVGSLTG